MADFTAATQRSDSIGGVIERDLAMTQNELQHSAGEILRINVELPIRISAVASAAVNDKFHAFAVEVDKPKLAFEASHVRAPNASLPWEVQRRPSS